MKNALLEREDCNVICVDWAGGAKRLYEQSVGNTRLVGAEIAELINFIISKNGGSKDLADRFLRYWIQSWWSNCWIYRTTSS